MLFRTSSETHRQGCFVENSVYLFLFFTGRECLYKWCLQLQCKNFWSFFFCFFWSTACLQTLFAIQRTAGFCFTWTLLYEPVITNQLLSYSNELHPLVSVFTFEAEAGDSPCRSQTLTVWRKAKNGSELHKCCRYYVLFYFSFWAEHRLLGFGKILTGEYQQGLQYYSHSLFLQGMFTCVSNRCP